MQVLLLPAQQPPFAQAGPLGQQDYVEGAFNQNYKSELFRAMKIKNNQKVTLRGTFGGTYEHTRKRGAPYVQLLNCEVVEMPAGD